MNSGGNVTNYALHQPSFAYSATGTTTEFDDALLQRGIVTQEQVWRSKGMSEADVERFTTEKAKFTEEQQQQSNSNVSVASSKTNTLDKRTSKNHDDDDGEGVDDDECDWDDDDDDEFLKGYRARRMLELQGSSHANNDPVNTTTTTAFGEVVYIDRTEWSRHVNEASMHAWVVVCLSSSDTERTGNVQAIVQEMAIDIETTKFVMIPSHSAIPHWPESNLPSLFLYRHGSMQHELIRIEPDVTRNELEETLRDLDVI